MRAGEDRGVVPRSESLHGIAGHVRGSRHLGQKLAVRAAEAKRAVELSVDLVAVLVNGAVVATTQERKIRKRRAKCRT